MLLFVRRDNECRDRQSSESKEGECAGAATGTKDRGDERGEMGGVEKPRAE